MTTLGGNICIRNGFRLDYCWRETVKSLLEVCDKVVICDCDSDDGTRKWIDDWAATESRIVPVNFPWTNPERTNQWWPEWINYSRQHLDTDMHLQLDADELIHPEDHEQIRNARDAKATLYFQRLNFWSDPKHLIPEGYCCGTKVLKMAPANMPIPSDYPYEPATRPAPRRSIRTSGYSTTALSGTASSSLRRPGKSTASGAAPWTSAWRALKSLKATGRPCRE